MTPVSHALLPVLFGHRWISRRPDGAPSWRESAAVAGAGVLPDLLSPHVGLDERHDAFSHSLLAWALFGLVLLTAVAVPRFRSLRLLARLCIVAYAAHLACDLITGGVPLLVPLVPGVFGGAYLPFWTWFVLDACLLAWAYLEFRWFPLRRRIRRRDA